MDYSGVLHSKVVPTSRLHKNARITRCGMTLTIRGGLPEAASEGTSGELKLIPPHLCASHFSLNSKHTPVPWHPSHSFLFAQLYDELDHPFAHDCTFILRNTVIQLAELNLFAKLGFELEFALLHPSTNAPYHSPEGTMQFASEMEFDAAATILDEIVSALAQMDISVTLVHAEAGPGQYEIVLAESDVERAVQNLVLARQTVRVLARRNGLQATFSPTWVNGIGNGGHVHISLDRHFGTPDRCEGFLPSGDDYVGVDETGRQFMAGVLDALPWLMFPLNNHVTSYKRVVPGAWVGAYQTWGINNKETPVRLVEDRTNFEVKVGDGISNPFLAVAAILTAGFIGVRKSLVLAPPCQVDPHLHKKAGTYALLPTSLKQSMEIFKIACKDAVLSTTFPDCVVQDWTAVCAEEISFQEHQGYEALHKMIMQVF